MTATHSTLSGHRVLSDGSDAWPIPVVTEAACATCSAPIWQSTDLADDDRWYDRNARAGGCTLSRDGQHAP